MVAYIWICIVRYWSAQLALISFDLIATLIKVLGRLNKIQIAMQCDPFLLQLI